jgi:hypothetical protein
LKKIKVSVNYEDTFFLENIIYNELILRGYAVYTGKTYKGEIDFVAIDGKKKCFIHLNIEDFLLHKERLLLS